VGVALPTPGRAGTARRCGFGKRDGKEYERNRRLKVPQKPNRPEPGGYGPGAVQGLFKVDVTAWRRADTPGGCTSGAGTAGAGIVVGT